MKTQYNSQPGKQQTFSVSNQPSKQSGFFLAVPVAGLVVMLGLGGGIIATHESTNKTEPAVANNTVLHQSEMSALETRPLSYQTEDSGDYYFDADG